MEEKSTLVICRSCKKSTTEEKIYDNTFGSILLFRARTNCRQLNWRKRFVGEINTCQVCMEGEVEPQEYFLRKCSELRHIRNHHGILKDVELGELLLFGERKDIDI